MLNLSYKVNKRKNQINLKIKNNNKIKKLIMLKWMI